MEELLKKMHIVKCEKLEKGWSRDVKYILTDADDRRFLLRLFDIALLAKKKKQFALLKKVEELDLPCSRALEVGVLNENQAYMVLTWLEGESADEVVKRVGDEEAYRLGVEAGKVLKKLHQIQVDPPQHSWWELYQWKIPRKIENLERCPLPFAYKDTVIPYVQERMELVKDREVRFSHADYHVGNLIVNNGRIGVIDFDKNTVADPYDEFKPFCWNVFASEYFETGLINGYFDNHVPADFFPILALYAAESMISNLPWAVGYGEKEVETAYLVADHMMKWYDGFRLTVPTWYKGESVRF